MYTSRVKIYDAGPYMVLSYGNGAAYEFTGEDRALFIQDEAASEFREMLDLLADKYPTEDALALMWDSYDAE